MCNKQYDTKNNLIFCIFCISNNECALFSIYIRQSSIYTNISFPVLPFHLHHITSKSFDGQNASALVFLFTPHYIYTIDTLNF